MNSISNWQPDIWGIDIWYLNSLLFRWGLVIKQSWIRTKLNENMKYIKSCVVCMHNENNKNKEKKYFPVQTYFICLFQINEVLINVITCRVSQLCHYYCLCAWIYTCYIKHYICPPHHDFSDREYNAMGSCVWHSGMKKWKHNVYQYRVPDWINLIHYSKLNPMTSPLATLEVQHLP